MNFRELTQQELIEILGISKPTVVAMGKESPALPSSKRGQNRIYDLQQVVAFLQDRAVRKAGLAQGKRLDKADIPRIDESEARKMAADAEIAEHKLAVLRGEVVPLSIYEEANARRIQRERAGMQAITHRIRTRLGPEVARVVEEEMGRVLSKMDRIQLEEPA